MEEKEEPRGEFLARYQSQDEFLVEARRWLPVQIDQEREKVLRVMSYNILAQCYVDGVHGNYFNVPKNYLDNAARKEKVLREILFIVPDVLCLQEFVLSDPED